MVESEDVKKAEIDRLYKENVSKVYRTALYYVEDHYVAEEIVQEVFLKLYDNLGDICMESVPAWLITTAKNMAKNYLRDNSTEYRKRATNPENPVFSGFSLYSENLSDTIKTHENVPVTNR